MTHFFASASSLIRHVAGRAPGLPTTLATKGSVLAVVLALGIATASASAPEMAAGPDALAPQAMLPHALKTQAQAPVEDGIAAAEAGQLARAITILSPHARRGDMKANYALGLIYMRSSDNDPGAAALSHEHFKRAARGGHVAAVFETAFQLERGIGTEPDLELAMRLYRLAAQSNHLNAQYNLAVLLSNGKGVDADLRQAYFWATAAHHNALRSPNPVLTESRIISLVKTIRDRIPYQQATQASTAAARLTGQPI